MNVAVDVAAQIGRAFSNIPSGAEVARVSGRAEDRLLKNLAKVKDTPTDQFIGWHADSLPTFTPEGVRHVLPYYMKYSLRHPRSEAAERLMFHLAPAETDDSWTTRLRGVLRGAEGRDLRLSQFWRKSSPRASTTIHISPARLLCARVLRSRGLRLREWQGRSRIGFDQ